MSSFYPIRYASVVLRASGRRARSAWSILCALLLVLLLAGTAGAMELVGRVGGKCSSIAHQGNHVFVCEGSGLAIFDDSSPGDPVVVARLPFDSLTTCVRLYDQVAYVGTEDGKVRLFDVSTPSSPGLLSTITGHGAMREAIFDGIYAYLATGDGFQILDISNTEAPVELSFTAIAGNTTDLALWGTVLYVSVGPSISTFDVTDRTTPASGDGITLPPYPNAQNVPFGTALIASQGDRLYVAWNVSLPNFLGIVIARLAIYHLAADQAPELLSQWAGLPPKTTDLVVSANRAFVAAQGRIQISDVSNPALPAEAGHLDIPVFDCALALDGDALHVAHAGGWLALDVANPSAITVDLQYGFTDDTFPVSRLAVGAGLCAAVRADNVLLMGTDDPSHPTILSSFTCSEQVVGAAIEGRYLYTSHRDTGIQIRDLSDPKAPALVGSLAPLAAPGVPDPRHGELSVSGGVATIAYATGGTNDWVAGLVTIDVSDPASPLLIGHASTQTTNWLDKPFMARRGDEVCISTGAPGRLHFFGLSDPDNPESLSTFNAPVSVGRVTWGDALVAVDTVDGTYVASVQDITNPSGLGLVSGSVSGSLRQLDSRDRLYSAPVAPAGVVVQGVTAPQTPITLDTLRTHDKVTCMTIAGGLVYAFDQSDGLLIAKTAFPDHVAQGHLLGSDTGAADQNSDGVNDAADLVLAMAAARE